MTRRSVIQTLSAGAVLAQAARPAASGGRLKQSFARWCYSKIAIDDLCRQAAEIGCVGIDLIEPEDWPVARKYGLTPTITQGKAQIPDGWNRKESHDRLEQELRARIVRAAEAKVPNVITFSGNRKGMGDQEGKENCILGLNRVKKFAEDNGVTVCMELLNSKVNHKDYMCDHTAWGVGVMQRVNSPRVKLLYDIYHMQIMEGDIARTITDNFQWIGHFHTGGNPGRHEIDGTQELDYHFVAETIAQLGFAGYMAHEYSPAPGRDAIASLKQALEICTV